jgi:hypothetical protein
VPGGAGQGRARYEKNRDSIQAVNKQSNARRVEEAKKYIYEVLSYSRCEDCGEYDFTLLTFHHVRGKKKMNVADMATRGCYEILKRDGRLFGWKNEKPIQAM